MLSALCVHRFRKLYSDLSAHVSAWMELAPFFFVILSLSKDIKKEVVKASAGHYPQPFWISIVKNWRKIRDA